MTYGGRSSIFVSIDVAMNEFDDSCDEELSARFVQLYSQHQRRVHAYIASILPRRADCDDVMQETSVVLWRKRREYDPSRNFFTWACGIAFFEILKFRRERGKDKLIFSEALIEELAEEVMRQTDALDERREHLTACIKQLDDRDRHLVVHRYRTGVTARQAARDLGRPESTVYKALARIRESLFQCVRRKMAQKGHVS